MIKYLKKYQGSNSLPELLFDKNIEDNFTFCIAYGLYLPLVPGSYMNLYHKVDRKHKEYNNEFDTNKKLFKEYLVYDILRALSYLGIFYKIFQ